LLRLTVPEYAQVVAREGSFVIVEKAGAASQAPQESDPRQARS
jgi:hypothetical protein